MEKIRDYSEIAEKNKNKVDVDDLIFGEVNKDTQSEK